MQYTSYDIAENYTSANLMMDLLATLKQACMQITGRLLGRTDIGIVISGQLLPVGLPPPRVYTGGHVAVGHVVCRLSIRSTDPSVIEPISIDPARFMAELCGRTMVEGINAGMF